MHLYNPCIERALLPAKRTPACPLLPGGVQLHQHVLGLRPHGQAAFLHCAQRTLGVHEQKYIFFPSFLYLYSCISAIVTFF